MYTIRKPLVILIFFMAFGWVTAGAQQLAFPGAEGFGRFAEGGRSGMVYHVTNLADSGKGSFREAVSAPHRTVVFDISGVIHISRRVSVSDHITIAGETAPGMGIVVYGDGVSFSGSNNDIVRYIRFRGSIAMSRGSCTLICDNAHDMIFDHVSVEWGRWDDLHIKNSSNITLSYCIIGEGIDPQRFGALLEGPVNLSIHHCLWINNQSRNPKGKAKMEFVNNVLYNWGSNGFVGGHSAADHYQDIVGNYFIAGPGSTDHFLSLFTKTDHVFEKGNYVDLNKDGKLNGRTVTAADFEKTGATLVRSRQAGSFPDDSVQKAAAAYQTVLAQAGASLKRDPVDSRLINALASLGTRGAIIHKEAEAGGQPAISTEKTPRDRDQDGMSDKWEKTHGLNPRNPADGNIKGPDGYTRLETYLHALARQR